ncbi:hypothetical protein Syun_025403 [Stephania yunnanensis]|uniref:Uncharacterized protein n=1 Tax=Stephania yunnanensis TaxID=152371 RepID=A0AAP0EX60_9MAGN
MVKDNANPNLGDNQSKLKHVISNSEKEKCPILTKIGETSEDVTIRIVEEGREILNIYLDPYHHTMVVFSDPFLTAPSMMQRSSHTSCSPDKSKHYNLKSDLKVKSNVGKMKKSITLIIVLRMILDLIQELSERSDGCGYVFIGANSESLIRVWSLPCCDLTETSKRDDGIDLLKDNQPLQRLTGTAEKAKMDLSSLTQTNISLPFITATAKTNLCLFYIA